MNKFARILQLIVGLGLVGAVLAPGLSPAQAASPLKIEDLYNPLKIVRSDLSIPANSIASLRSAPKTYVPASISMSLDGRVSGSVAILVRLKGSTSLQYDGGDIDGTPSFKIKFPKATTPYGYLGLRRMTFNAMLQDNSKIHEYGAYALFNAMGVPASKTGWQRIYMNGKDMGLYINVETPDSVFMQKRFKDITQHIYEGRANKDWEIGNSDGTADTGSFLVDYGWKVTPNKDDLSTLFDYMSDFIPADWYKGMATATNRTLLIRSFAVENFLSHWDSYSGPLKNNYFLRSNTKGQFTYIPWGTDQTFGENRKTDTLGDTFSVPLLATTSAHPYDSRKSYRGKAYVMCIQYSVCKKAYLLELKAVSAKATGMKLATQMKAVANVINPVLAIQFKNNPSKMTLALNEQTRSISYIAKRQSEVAALLKSNGIK
ncbi:MAG: CotH kinase family protein [Rhodoluna sp.]